VVEERPVNNEQTEAGPPEATQANPLPANSEVKPASPHQASVAEHQSPNFLERLAIVSDGQTISLELVKPERPDAVAATIPTPPAPSGPEQPEPAPPRQYSSLPDRQSLYPEVKLQDMFPLLRQMGSQLTTSATAGELAGSANTSGSRHKAVLPVEARRWSWAGFVPGGAFGFALGIPVLGFLGLLGLLTGKFGLFLLWPLYIIAVGAKGREIVWRTRRFESVAQFNAMTGAWDSVGKMFILVDVVIYVVMLAISNA
jgi:hypothetical protein